MGEKSTQNHKMQLLKIKLALKNIPKKDTDTL